MITLNDKQKRFAQEYLVDLNETQAAIRAGYATKSAHNQGARLIKHDEVKAEIKRLMDARSEKVGLTADDVLNELRLLSESSILDFLDVLQSGDLAKLRNLPKSLCRAISGIDVTTDAKGGVTVKIRLWDKLRALEMTGKHLGMFVERKEVGRPGEFAEMSDDELYAERERLRHKAFGGGAGNNPAGSAKELPPVH